MGHDESEQLEDLARRLERRVQAKLIELATNPQAAVDLMDIAAGCLRSRMRMPDELADWLATGLSQAAKANPKERGAVLATKLNLKGESGRPGVSGEYKAAQLVYEHDAKTDTERRGQYDALVSEVMEALDVSRTKAKGLISEARDRIEEDGPPPSWPQIMSRK